MKPSLFVIGNSKSGTTALYHFLSEHPNIFMCSPKEPNYFARDFCRDPNPNGAFHQLSEMEYINLFRKAVPGQTCGESSACYFYSQEAAKGISSYNPDARLIVMLREPVSFLYSYYWQLRKNPRTEGEVVRSFGNALALEARRENGSDIPRKCLVPELLFYSRRIKYADQLVRLYKYFHRSQIKVIIYEDFKEDNQSVFESVLRFLGLDDSFRPAIRLYNQGTATRSRLLKRLVHDASHGVGWGAPIKGLAKQVVSERLRKRITSVAVDKLVFSRIPKIDPILKVELMAEYRDEVEKTGLILGKDMLQRWGYK